jgi:RecJ-like exonuclease
VTTTPTPPRTKCLHCDGVGKIMVHGLGPQKCEECGGVGTVSTDPIVRRLGELAWQLEQIDNRLRRVEAHTYGDGL